jgi:hypothetical protein
MNQNADTSKNYSKFALFVVKNKHSAMFTFASSPSRSSQANSQTLVEVGQSWRLPARDLFRVVVSAPWRTVT